MDGIDNKEMGLAERVQAEYGVSLHALLVRWYGMDGCSIVEIAERLGVTTFPIQQAIRKYDVVKNNSQWLKYLTHKEKEKIVELSKITCNEFDDTI